MSTVRKPRKSLTLEVLRTERLTSHLQRVILGNGDIDEITDPGYTDTYSKLLFPVPGSGVTAPFDINAVREELPREQWPVTRTYTIRRIDQDAKQVWIDFVVHGDSGLAGPWALNAQPGDKLTFLNPVGAYSPNTEADWYAFVGDESAIPAISSALESLAETKPEARGWAVIEIAEESDRMDLAAPEDLAVHWVVRGGEPAGDASITEHAVRVQPWLEGEVDVFAHGEREAMKAMRRYFRTERGVDRKALSLSGYWAFGRVEDDFQAEKRTPVGQIFEPEDTATA
ncbi:siderophore-interacting protein [Haematomicrobium sanguinis]|uniref:siderophore-interacting protein n=1 Tax=Haematomicrobium sanguinis TaxID=479106 RepID=UPI00047CEB37|nr:siderophore-interacting protein [Haematomicrobium sanguinis]